MDEELRGVHVSEDTIARPVFNPANPQHLWVALAFYRLPTGAESGAVLLDHENLVALSGPKCFFCARRPRDAAAQCPGKP